MRCWDYYVNIKEQHEEEGAPGAPNDAPGILVSHVLDETTLGRFIKKAYENGKDAHKYLGIYVTQAKKISLPDAGKLSDGLDFRADFSELPSPRWLALKVDFELQTPWYSKDDRVFHVLDNPVRKDRVFGIPFMAASSWKGMLRWACRMRAGLGQYLQERPDMAEWSDPAWILHLFGNEKGEGEEFSRGALVFYPTWFDKIGFQVINPHSRENRAGKGPIYYEVVPPGAKGTLSLLYAPWPGMKFTADPKEVLPWLLEAIETLLTVYGISAKRTVGWGTAKIEKWRAFHNTGKNVEKESREDLWREVQAWLPGGSAP
jgi:CRISPR-associated protein Cmr2